MMTKKGFVLTTVAVAIVGLSVSTVVGWNSHERGKTSDAAWAFMARNADELTQFADAVVIGKTMSSIPTRAVPSESGDHQMSFEAVEVEVIHSLKGSSPGSMLLVERAASIDENGRQAPIDVDGGQFQAGSVNLLFLKLQGDGPFYYQINEQSRYELYGRTLLGLDEHDPVAASFHGKTLEEAVAVVNGALSK